MRLFSMWERVSGTSSTGFWFFLWFWCTLLHLLESSLKLIRMTASILRKWPILFSGSSGLESTFLPSKWTISRIEHRSIWCWFYLFSRKLLKDGKQTDMDALLRRSLNSRLLRNNSSLLRKVRSPWPWNKKESCKGNRKLRILKYKKTIRSMLRTKVSNQLWWHANSLRLWKPGKSAKELRENTEKRLSKWRRESSSKLWKMESRESISFI